MKTKNKIYSLVPKNKENFDLRECFFYIPTGTKKTNGIPAVISYGLNNEPFMTIGSNIELENAVNQKESPYGIEKAYEIPKDLASLVIRKNEVENSERNIEWLFPELADMLDNGD